MAEPGLREELTDVALDEWTVAYAIAPDDALQAWVVLFDR